MFPITAILLTLLLLNSHIASAYYLSLNTFEFQQAEDFCIKHCKSNLASVHSDYQYHQIISLHNNTENISKNDNIYIGLNDKVANGEWKWTDGTQFDFANDTSGGVYPYNLGGPGGDDCIIIEGSNDLFEWNDKSCTTSPNHDYRFVCNHCYGVLTKYIVIEDIYNNYNTMQAECESSFGTSLASIHSYQDIIETTTLCKLAGKQSISSETENCYIGLYEQSTEYLFNDGTLLSVNANITNSFNLPCVALDSASNYSWIDTACDVNNYAICNKPSEICYSNIWNVITGAGWNWLTSPCELGIKDNDKSIAIISGKKWLNSMNQPLVIEYMYTMNKINTIKGSNAGVIIHINTTCNHFYYFGISTNSINVSNIFLAEMINDQQQIIVMTPLGFMYRNGTFYLLKIKVFNGTLFAIYLDNIEYINVTHNAFNNVGNEESGNIGIYNRRTNIVAKSLFVSGTILYQNDTLNATKWFKKCPTPSPTYYPTSSPITFNATPSPTYSPIVIKTPTVSPTSEVTEYPTLNPSSSDQTYGVYITINFTYNLTDNVDAEYIGNLLLNVTTSIIQNEIKNYSLQSCIDSNDDYDIIIIINNSSAIITATVFVCNVSVQNLLVETFENYLETYFMDKIRNNTVLIVDENSIDIDVDSIYKENEQEIRTTNGVYSSSNSEAGEPKETGEAFDEGLVILFVVIGILCFVVVGLLIIIKHKINKNKQLTDNAHAHPAINEVNPTVIRIGSLSNENIVTVEGNSMIEVRSFKQKNNTNKHSDSDDDDLFDSVPITGGAPRKKKHDEEGDSDTDDMYSDKSNPTTPRIPKTPTIDLNTNL